MSLTFIEENCQRFAYRPYALYSADVTFQHTSRPCDNLVEAGLQYSTKPKLYGFKKEPSVLPNGITILVSDHGKKSEVDISGFLKAVRNHYQLTKKK